MTPQKLIERVFEASPELLQVRVLPYGTKVSPHLSAGVDTLASPDTNEVCLMPPLLDLFEEARRLFGKPMPVTAGFRTHAHEKALEARGYRTAKFVSPHSLGSALDIDARPAKNKTEAQVNREIQAVLKEAARNLDMPKPRLGHKAYKESFTHVDVIFLLFAPFTALPHPAKWKELTPEQKAAVSAWVPGTEW
jgi:hypothetical protein